MLQQNVKCTSVSARVSTNIPSWGRISRSSWLQWPVDSGGHLIPHAPFFHLVSYRVTNVLMRLLEPMAMVSVVFSFYSVFPAGSDSKESPAIQETRVQSLGWEEPLAKWMATHSSILTWRIPWTEESGRLYSPWGHRVGPDWQAFTFTVVFSTYCY